MSGPTISGGTTPNNFTSNASGSNAAFMANFAPGMPFTAFDGPGVSTVSGAVVIGASATVSGSAVNDTSPGGNSITTTKPAVVFGSTNDTISAGAAATIFGSNTGTTTFIAEGEHSSITGGTGDIRGDASGANTTLVGGTANSMFTVTGAGSLAVGGSAGITGIDLRGSTAGITVATNPNGNSGEMVAYLGAGADTVLGGSGASTIVGGTGPDVYAFTKGHAGGSEVILGFNAHDNIAFSGYTEFPVEQVELFKGIPSDVLTLEDGTKITLVGIDHKLF